MLEKPRRGRPSISPVESSTDLHFRVETSLYDRAYSAASRDGVSVPEAVRQAMRRVFVTENRQPDE
jgi:predicted HicB family RNase H-like nuclease